MQTKEILIIKIKKKYINPPTGVFLLEARKVEGPNIKQMKIHKKTHQFQYFDHRE